MQIEGYWYEVGSSRRSKATITVDGQHYQLQANDAVITAGAISELTISDRLGDTQRRLSWPNGQLFETADNTSVDNLLSNSRSKPAFSSLLHRLENHTVWAVIALVITILVSYVGIRYGLPAASERIAKSLPTSVNTSVSSQALATLDRTVFSPSDTDESTRESVQEQFNQLISQLPQSDIPFTLHFRNMRGLPNAMALPGGDIVVTDAFLDLVEHPQELDSVLLHEIGHVMEHHGMTQVIRASAVSVIVALAFGDLSTMGDLAVGVPVFMMQNSYSQTAESEADQFAFKQMEAMGKDPRHFADIILRLTEQELDDNESTNKSSYFASHPDSRARARKALEASQSQ